MKLPELTIKEVHYWAVVIYDEFRPAGEEYPKRHETSEEAQQTMDRLVRKQLGTKRDV